MQVGCRPHARRLAALAVAGLLVAGLLVVGLGASAAQAITAIENGTGFPSDTVTVRLRNDAVNAPNSLWQVVAAPQTVITSAQGAHLRLTSLG